MHPKAEKAASGVPIISVESPPSEATTEAPPSNTELSSDRDAAAILLLAAASAASDTAEGTGTTAAGEIPAKVARTRARKAASARTYRVIQKGYLFGLEDELATLTRAEAALVGEAVSTRVLRPHRCAAARRVSLCPRACRRASARRRRREPSSPPLRLLRPRRATAQSRRAGGTTQTQSC